jgi:hypothetical protein
VPGKKRQLEKEPPESEAQSENEGREKKQSSDAQPRKSCPRRREGPPEEELRHEMEGTSERKLCQKNEPLPIDFPTEVHARSSDT